MFRIIISGYDLVWPTRMYTFSIAELILLQFGLARAKDRGLDKADLDVTQVVDSSHITRVTLG